MPKRRSILWPIQIVLAAGVGFAVGIGFVASGATMSDVTSIASNVRPDCHIKGNVSHNGGELIFHVPGQKDYDRTIINPAYGERWFCTEAEARAAGWRKAGR